MPNIPPERNIEKFLFPDYDVPLGFSFDINLYRSISSFDSTRALLAVSL